MGEQTSSKRWNILMLNARIHVQDVTLEGNSPPGKIGNQATKDIKDGSTWLDMRQAQAIWLKLQSQGSQHKAQEGRKSS